MPDADGLTWNRGSWMQTFTGKQFWPMDPKPYDVDPVDIAHALSLLCRYNGHVKRFYSVAEHCVHLSHVVSPEKALEALLHDATEAYVGDMVRPLKRHMPAYTEAEARVAEAIAVRFRLPSGEMSDEVREADNRILLDERAVLLRTTEHAWEVEGLEPLGVQIEGWSPGYAEVSYLARLSQLTAFTPPRREWVNYTEWLREGLADV